MRDLLQNNLPLSSPYDRWVEAGLSDREIERHEALAILRGDGVELLPLIAAAGAVRRRHCGDTVTVHILDNVQNGACPEDCSYCGQSKISEAPIQPYKLKPVDAIVDEARAAQASGAWRFCMALSGRGPDERDISHMSEAIRQVKAMGMRTCLSAGIMDADKTRALKEAGLDRLNHNLNTSRDHYPSICTTHTHDDRVRTLEHARAAGLGLCSGLIAGMGERFEDLIDVAYQLRAFRAESIPVNLLLPIAGNPEMPIGCEGAPLNPVTVLRILCMMRLVNPTAEVRVAAGREHHLRSLQPLALWPANSLFVDGYLLTEGVGPGATFQMIRDAGFRVALEDGAPDDIRRMAEGLDQLSTPDSGDAWTPDGPTRLKPSVAKRTEGRTVTLTAGGTAAATSVNRGCGH